jgi:hypothetical protein
LVVTVRFFFEEGIERSDDYVVEKYDDEKNFQCVSYIGEIAGIFLPKKQYNADMLVPSLNLLGMVCRIQI